MNITDIPEDQRPKIEFPCDYPIKVMGTAASDFEVFVCDIMGKHAEIDVTSIKMKESSKGTFQSVTISITATGKPQIEAIYEELMKSGRVKMVL